MLMKITIRIYLFVFANWDFKFLPLMQHLVVFLRQLLQLHCLLLILQILHPLPLLQEVCLGEQRLVMEAVQQQVRQERQLLQRLRDFLGFQEQAKIIVLGSNYILKNYFNQ